MKRNIDTNLPPDSGKRNKIQNDELWEDDNDIMFTQDDLQTIDAQEKQCLHEIGRFNGSHGATVSANGKEVDALQRKIRQLEDEKRKLIEEQYAKDGNITMMKASVAAKDEQLRQLLEEKQQREKLYMAEKTEREKKHAEELQKLHCQLMFEQKEKLDEKDTLRRLLKQQQQEAENSVIPPTQDLQFGGSRSRTVSCSPHKQQAASSPARRLSLANHSNKKVSLDNKLLFPSEQTFRETTSSRASDSTRGAVGISHTETALCQTFCHRLTLHKKLGNVSQQKCVHLVRQSKLLELTAWPTDSVEGTSKEEEEAVRLACHGMDLLLSESDSDLGAVYLLPAVDACIARCRRQLTFSTPSSAGSADNRTSKQPSQGSSNVRAAKISSRHASVCTSNHTSQLSESQSSTNVKTPAECGDDDTMTHTVTLLQLLTHLLSWHPHLATIVSLSATDTLVTMMCRVSNSSQLLAKKVKIMKLFDQVLEWSSSSDTNVSVVCESLHTINLVIKASRHTAANFSWCARVCQLAACFTRDTDKLAYRALDVLESLCLYGGVCIQHVCAAPACTMMAVYRYCADLDLSQQDSRSLLGKMFTLVTLLLTNPHYGPALLLQANCHCSATLVRTIVMGTWKIIQLAAENNTVLSYVQQGLRVLHDLYLKDVHWLAHRRDVEHYFTDLCIHANHVFTVNEFAEDLRVLADMNDVRETETEVAGSVAMVTVSDATTDNKRTTASVIVID